MLKFEEINNVDDALKRAVAMVGIMAVGLAGAVVGSDIAKSHIDVKTAEPHLTRVGKQLPTVNEMRPENANTNTPAPAIKK